MKRWMLMVAVLSLILCFATGCDKSNVPSSEGNGKVGDALDAPEACISFDDEQDITLIIEREYYQQPIKHQSVYAISSHGNALSLYVKEQATLTDTGEIEFDYEYVCHGTKRIGDIYTRSFDGNWESCGRDEETFVDMLSKFSVSGYDYAREPNVTYDKFVKWEDETVDGVSCYVYTTVCTEVYEGETIVSDFKIWVDKETGIWRQLDISRDGEKISRRKVVSMENNASVIPEVSDC